MAKGRINMSSVNRKVAQAQRLKNRMDKEAQDKFNQAKVKLLQDFDSHPVTQEIKEGPTGSNLSKTLGGYGNLFSFIGFNEGQDPTTIVREFLSSFIKLKKTSTKGSLNVNYSVTMPTMKDFGFAVMPWEGGKSWVEGVEIGISGFNYYMSKASAVSRAGVGIQIDNQLRSRESSAGIEYMSQILRNFKKEITK